MPVEEVPTSATPTLDPQQLANELKMRGRALGFDLVGIAPARPSQYREYLRNWLDAGQHGAMSYVANRFEERTDPAVYLPGAQSVICLATNYHQVDDDSAPSDRTAGQTRGRIAEYALGQDYHDVLRERLFGLADWLRLQCVGSTLKVCVDTAPVMEKELAAVAGLGWIGKNTCLINERIGSWVFLSEIITTIALPVDSPAIDRCGTCRRCIDACPTDALAAPYQLDARKCISYLTIEHRSAIEPGLQTKMGDWLYGCDVCQDVCPFNSKALASVDPAFKSRFDGDGIDPAAVLAWDQRAYAEALRGSAMKRVKLPVLQRNAQIVLENGKHKSGSDET